MVEVQFSKIGSAAVGAPVNNMLHSLFDNCIIKLNGNVLSDSNKNYHYSAYLLDLLDRGQEQKDGLMTGQGWYKDTAKLFDTAEDKNLGWKKRKSIAGLNAVQLIGPLHSELFNQERYMLSDVEVSVELTLNKETLYFMAEEEGSKKYIIKIKDAKIYVPYVQVSQKIMEEIQQSKKPAIYPIQRVHTKTLPIRTTGTDFTLDISKGRLPKRMVIGLVTDKAKAGAYKLNPYNFRPLVANVYNLTRLEVNVDGMPYAKRAFTPEFDKDLFSKEFLNLYESLNYLEDGTNPPAIPFEDFKFGYALFPFTLSPGCISEPGAFKKEGELSVELTFEKAPTEALQAVVMCVYDNNISIDEQRNIETDW